jgi:transketolase
MQLRHEPAALILTRQAIPTFDRSKYASASGVAKGAYILAGSPDQTPELILMATGSEVSLCISAYEKLTAQGRKVRVVSMPSWEIFEHQSPEYRESVLPSAVTARIAVEQASTFGWAQYVGHAGRVIGMKTFGASAPLKELLKKFGFTPEAVLQAAREMLGKSSS